MLIRTLHFEHASIIAAVICSLTVAGLLKPRRGTVRFLDEDVTGMPAFKLVQRGLVLVPEARQLWPQMTVRENLDLGAYGKEAREHRHATLRTVLEMFPILEKRAQQIAGYFLASAR